MKYLQEIGGFLLALGPLILFHELGHYCVARLCGVKVLRFSLGFGKVLWSRRFSPGGTEWVVCALPLGGYVRMLDSRDPDMAPLAPGEEKQEFTRQSVWRRMAIIAAGPIANFILAIAVFAGLYMAGVDEPGTRLRAMAENTPAWQAGLRGGDQVKAVNGTPVTAWTELRWELLQAVVDKTDARIDVERPGAGQFSYVLPASALRDMTPESDVERLLGLSIALPPARLLEVVPGGGGAAAGLLKGDLVTAIAGKPVHDASDVLAAVRGSQGRTLQFDIQRNGQALSLPVTPRRDETGKAWQIKVIQDTRFEVVTVSYGPIGAVAMGARMTWSNAVMQLKLIGKMIKGELSLKNITGPLTIADYAGQTVRMGPSPFLSFIALVSISLGVMNLLPIPVLDGGHLLYYSLEVLTGRPLPERIGEYAQRFGVSLLVMLMALALFNDVARRL
jgi:regulator of sigma E protease